MRNKYFTDKQLKQVLKVHSEILYPRQDDYASSIVFSKFYQQRKEYVIHLSDREITDSLKIRYRRVMRRVASVAASVLLILGVIAGVRPSAFAAVGNWASNIYNKIIDYTFRHTFSYHADAICYPAYLPDGYDVFESYHDGYYTRRVYKNYATGESIILEYRRPTSSQKNAVTKLEGKAERYVTYKGQVKYNTEYGSKNMLVWYDSDLDLLFRVESDMNNTALLTCFWKIDIRLPDYAPRLIPNGYKEIGSYSSYPSRLLVYSNENEEYLIVEYSVLSASEKLIVDVSGADISLEELEVDGMQGQYYQFSSTMPRSGLMLVDYERDLVFTVEADNLPKEALVGLITSMELVETDW